MPPRSPASAPPAATGYAARLVRRVRSGDIFRGAHHDGLVAASALPWDKQNETVAAAGFSAIEREISIDVPHWLPVDASRLHRHMRALVRRQPLRQAQKIRRGPQSAEVSCAASRCGGRPDAARAIMTADRTARTRLFRAQPAAPVRVDGVPAPPS